MKLVVTFVCRILKESERSSVFKVHNPWINANLQILREIFDYSISTNANGANVETIYEIEALVKHLKINTISDIPHKNFFQALTTNTFISSSQQIEVQHLKTKTSLIP